MNKLFDGYEPWFGPIPQRNTGALVSDRNGKVTTYACIGMVDRGEMFINVGIEVYDGMIIGERNRTEDLNVNITREKKKDFNTFKSREFIKINKEVKNLINE